MPCPTASERDVSALCRVRFHGMNHSSFTRLLSAGTASKGPPQSLQMSLGLALGVLILTSSLLLAGVGDRIARHELFAMAEANLFNISRQTSRELSAGMNDFSREIETMAGLDSFRRRDVSPDEMRDNIENLVRHRPEFTFIGVADAESSLVLASNGHIFEGGLGRGRPVFEEGRKGLFLGEVHQAARLAELLPKPADGEPLRFLDIAAPVRDYDGKVVRVLTAHLRFDWTEDVRKAVLGPRNDSQTVEILLVDMSGQVVLAPNRSVATGTPLLSLLQGPLVSGRGPQTWADQKQYLSVVAPVNPRGSFGGFGWTVVARQPVDAALQPLRRLHDMVFGGAALLGIVAAVLAWLIARRIVAPVQRLARTAALMTVDPNSIPPIDPGINEVTQMEKALQRLATQGQRHAQSSADQQKQFMTFAESLPHLVWQADHDGLILYANDQWEERFGAARGLSVPQLARFLHPADCEPFLRQWDECRTSGAALEAKVRVDGNAVVPARWFRIRGKAVLSDAGSIFGWVGTFTDIHNTVLLAEAAAGALEHERIARLEVERVSRMKDEFLSTLSHELRTPLNVIGGYAQMLQLHPGSEAQVMRTATIINRNVRLQVELISDLLDMSTVTAGKVVLDPVLLDAGHLTNDLVLSMAPAAAARQVSLRCAPGASGTMVRADQKRLLQILTNLLSNAIKFTEAGGSVVLDISAGEGWVRFDVTDSGCGISPEFLPHVFDRFRQEDASSTRRRGGIGLGLALARSLTVLHGGTITASSAGIGQGATFSISLPTAPAGAVHAAHPLSELPSLHDDTELDGLRILVADDETDTRVMIAALLRGCGASVMAAASAREALQIVERERFDILVFDIGMPDMDGHALIRAVRRLPDPAAAATPAIAVTAFVLTQDARASLDAGFSLHLAKPTSRALLVQAIRQLVPREPDRAARSAMA